MLDNAIATELARLREENALLSGRVTIDMLHIFNWMLRLYVLIELFVIYLISWMHFYNFQISLPGSGELTSTQVQLASAHDHNTRLRSENKSVNGERIQFIYISIFIAYRLTLGRALSAISITTGQQYLIFWSLMVELTLSSARLTQELAALTGLLSTADLRIHDLESELYMLNRVF